LEDQDENVRQTAAQALVPITGQDFGGDVNSWWKER